MLNGLTLLALSNAILAFSSLFGVFLLIQGYRIAVQKIPVMCALIAFAMVTIASVFGMLSTGFSPAWSAPFELMSEATRTLAPPALAAAIASLRWKKEWSQQNWWRAMIGLMVGYELARWSGYLVLYQNTIAAASIGIMVAAVVSSSGTMQRTFTLFLTVAIIAYSLVALALFAQGSAEGFLHQELYRYLLALGNLFSASAIFSFLKCELRARSL